MALTTLVAASGVETVASTISFNVSGVLDNFWQLTVDGLGYGAIYALVAVGYTLVYGVLKLINFAHSEIFMLGMFGQYVGLWMMGFAPSPNTYHVGTASTIVYLLLAMVIGMIVTGLAAVALERTAYRPLRKRGAKPLIFLITAIGVSFILQEFVHFVLPKAQDIAGAVGISLPESLRSLGGSVAEPPIRLVQSETQFSFFGASITNVTLIVVGVALLLALATDTLVNRTKLGRSIRAVAQDPNTATLMGVSRERVIMLTFLIGGVLAGAAALLYTIKIPNGIIYSGGFILGIKAFSAAVLGGIGNLRGALLGGLLLGVIEMYGQMLLGTQWRDVVAFMVLVLVLMFRPTGILGESLGKARV